MVDRSGGRTGSGGGLFTVVSTAVLILAVVAVGVAAVLLGRTLVVAHSISDKAAIIATTGRGINTSTDSVIQLSRTNTTAASILESAKPLEGVLTRIVNSAGEINTLAGGINGTAGAINGVATGIGNSAGAINTSAVTIGKNAGGILNSAGTINGVAKDIDGKAGDILDVAKKVNRDAKDINDSLDKTIDVAKDIRGDTGNIVIQGVRILVTSSCIAQKLNTPVLVALLGPAGTSPTPDCK